LGLRVVARTGDASTGGSPTGCFGLDALGFRISRLLRFCDFAMSECFLFGARFGQSLNRRDGGDCCRHRLQLRPEKWVMGLGGRPESGLQIGKMLLACSDVAGAFRPAWPPHGQLLIFECFIETHNLPSCVKRGHILSLSREGLGSDASRCGGNSTD